MTVQGPVKKQQPDGMSHGGGGGVRVQRMGPGGGGVAEQSCAGLTGLRPVAPPPPPTSLSNRKGPAPRLQHLRTSE